jgi:hypothetical protein
MTILKATPVGYFASLLFLADVWTNGSHCKEPRHLPAIELASWTCDHDDYYYFAAAAIVADEKELREWNAQAVYEIRRGV